MKKKKTDPRNKQLKKRDNSKSKKVNSRLQREDLFKELLADWQSELWFSANLSLFYYELLKNKNQKENILFPSVPSRVRWDEAESKLDKAFSETDKKHHMGLKQKRFFPADPEKEQALNLIDLLDCIWTLEDHPKDVKTGTLGDDIFKGILDNGLIISEPASFEMLAIMMRCVSIICGDFMRFTKAIKSKAYDAYIKTKNQEGYFSICGFIEWSNTGGKEFNDEGDPLIKMEYTDSIKDLPYNLFKWIVFTKQTLLKAFHETIGYHHLSDYTKTLAREYANMRQDYRKKDPAIKDAIATILHKWPNWEAKKIWDHIRNNIKAFADIDFYEDEADEHGGLLRGDNLRKSGEFASIKFNTFRSYVTEAKKHKNS